MSWIRRLHPRAWGLLALCVAIAANAADSFEERDAEIMRVLDRYMDGLNDLDLERHVATYHFPHYRHASGEIVVWQSAREAIPGLDSSGEERRAALRAVLEPDWHRSEWTRRDIVQGDAEKVHVATRFVRLRADGSVIETFDSLYVLTRESGRWGIKGRSSFAP
jgi:PAS domain-containing protein